MLGLSLCKVSSSAYVLSKVLLRGGTPWLCECPFHYLHNIWWKQELINLPWVMQVEDCIRCRNDIKWLTGVSTEKLQPRSRKTKCNVVSRLHSKEITHAKEIGSHKCTSVQCSNTLGKDKACKSHRAMLHSSTERYPIIYPPEEFVCGVLL